MSTLKTNTIQAATGSTITVANGTALAGHRNPGEIIQSSGEVRYDTLTTTTASGSPTGGVTIGDRSIVAKQANTRVQARVRMVWWHYNGNDAAASIGEDVNGTSYGNYDAFAYIATQDGIRYNSVMTFRHGGDTDDANNWGSKWAPFIVTGIYHKDVTNNVGDTLNYQLKVWNTASSTTYINRSPGVNSNYHGTACGCGFEILEIQK